MTLQAPEFWVVIPAAGRGSRMQQSMPKQYLELSGQKVIEYSLGHFAQDPDICGIVVVTDDDAMIKPIISKFKQSYPNTRFHITSGGVERVDSVKQGLVAIDKLSTTDDVWVLVHDAARPCLTRRDITRLKQSAEYFSDGAILAAPIVDTLKQIDNVRITHTHNRQHFMRALTPQMAPVKLLIKAIEHCQSNNISVTDEAQALESIGASVGIVEGRHDNIKITYPADLAFAEFILTQQANELDNPSENNTSFNKLSFNKHTENSDGMKS